MNDSVSAGTQDVSDMRLTRGTETPSIFFVSLPKSGTVYTWYSLQSMTGLAMPAFHELEGWSQYTVGRDFSCPDLYACGDYNTQLLIPAGMQHYLKGMIFGAHMQASWHNMTILQEAGIDRITVLLRDPRDAFISWVYHLRNLGPQARDYHSKIYHIPRSYYTWPLRKQFDFQIRTFFPTTVNWIEGWLDYYAAPERTVDVLFVYYDELKQQPERYIRRIAEHHEIDEVDYSKVIAAEPGRMHFRKGENEQWKEEFDTANQRLVEELMQDRIAHDFARAASSDPHLVSFRRNMKAGRPRLALRDALEAMIRFPAQPCTYDALLEAARACNTDALALRQRITEKISKAPTIAQCFSYPFDVVEACREFVEQTLRTTAQV